MKSLFKKIFGKKNIEYTEKVTSLPLPTKLLLEALPDNAEDYLQNNIGLAGEIIKDIGLAGSSHLFAPDSLGRAIQMWFDTDLENRFGVDVNMYSNALAAGWGKYLEEELGMEWHVITDEFGTEIGLYHKNNSTTIFPFQSTAKAFNNKDYGLLSALSKKTIEVINK
jgi:hypothetical protein